MLEGAGVNTGVDLEQVLVAATIAEQAVGHSLSSSLYRAGGRLRPTAELQAHGRRTEAVRHAT